MAKPRPSIDTGEPLANPRHERFAQLVVSGLPARVAHAQAGFTGTDKSHDANASRLIKDDKVAARIAALRAPARAIIQAQAEEAAGSAAWIVEKATQVVRMAFDQERPGIATPALALLAKMHPEFSDKHEVTGDVRLRVEALAAVAQMTPEQLLTLAEQARSEG